MPGQPRFYARNVNIFSILSSYLWVLDFGWKQKLNLKKLSILLRRILRRSTILLFLFPSCCDVCSFSFIPLFYSDFSFPLQIFPYLVSFPLRWLQVVFFPALTLEAKGTVSRETGFSYFSLIMCMCVCVFRVIFLNR